MHDPVVEVEPLHIDVPELDPSPLEQAQGTAKLILPTMAYHLPEQRRLEDVVGGTIDEHDPMPGRDAPLQLARRDQAPVPPPKTTVQPVGESARLGGGFFAAGCR